MLEDFETGSEAEREELSQTDRLGCNALGEKSMPAKLSEDDVREHEAAISRLYVYRCVNGKTEKVLKNS